MANSKVPLDRRTEGASSVGVVYSKVPLDLRAEDVQENVKSKAKLKVEHSSNSEDHGTHHRVGGGIKEEVTSYLRDDNSRSLSPLESQNFQNKGNCF